MKNIRLLLRSIFSTKLPTAVIISSVFVLVLSGYSFKAVNDFYQHKATVYPNLTFNTDRFLFFLRNVFKQEYIRLTTSSPDKDSALPSFHIFVDKKDLAKLDEDLPKSGWDQYVTAYMKTNESEKLRRVDIRYRGFSHYHWLYKKKSLRIKLAKGDLHNMERKFNLINMPSIFMTNEITNYQLAKNGGLMTPEYYPVRVFMNAQYMGVYMYVSQIEESFLRKHKRMPGSIYYGEDAKLTANKESTLWENESNWKKAAARSIEYKDDRNDIQKLINAINNYSDNEFYTFFNDYMDKEKFYSFFSLDSYFGGTHHDYYHNHKIYFDPYKGKFEPIAWDLRFWTSIAVKDTSFNPLLARIKLNPILEYERDLYAYRFLKQNKLDTTLKLYDRDNKKIFNDMKKDIYKDTALYSAPFPLGAAVPYTMSNFTKSANNLKQTLKLRHRYLEKIYQPADVIYHHTKLDNKTHQLTFKVSGNNPVTIDLYKTLANNNQHIKIYRSGSNDKLSEVSRSDKEIIYPGRKYTNGNSFGSKNIELFGTSTLINAPLYYQYIIKGENLQIPNEMTIQNAITNEDNKIKQLDFKIHKLADSIHPWDIPEDKRKTVTLSGINKIEKTQVYDKNTQIIIKPGTQFILAPNISMVFNGQVTARGNKARPIRFMAKDSNKPWGSIIVQGQTTSGSQFDYIQVSGGSIHTHNLINYPGQFNIHDSSNFILSNCLLQNNKLGDDNLHIAYSSGTIDSCHINNSASDALDADISTINISNSLFTNSGNDALDFMTSNIIVNNNIVIQAGDKCISTGEWSEGEYNNNIFASCYTGIEVKDKSSVTLNNNVILNSKDVAINLYKKNLRYDSGGKITASNNHITGSKTISSDEYSDYTINKTQDKLPDINHGGNNLRSSEHLSVVIQMVSKPDFLERHQQTIDDRKIMNITNTKKIAGITLLVLNIGIIVLILAAGFSTPKYGSVANASAKANKLFTDGDYIESSKIYTKCAEIVSSKESKSTYYTHAARSYMAQKNFKPALTSISNAIRNNPTNGIPYQILEWILDTIPLEHNLSNTYNQLQTIENISMDRLELLTSKYVQRLDQLSERPRFINELNEPLASAIKQWY